MEIKTIYEDKNVLVVDKPAGVVVFDETLNGSALLSHSSLIEKLTGKYPELKNAGESPRYGIAHRLDKDTSGILLVAKTSEALIFFQKQFKNRGVEKKYMALANGVIKEDEIRVETLIGRSPMDKRKQKAYDISDPKSEGKREAVTVIKVLERFQDFSLLEVEIKTGRRHQIRCHLSYIQHPIAGDKLYGFKNSKTPEGLKRQFLHAAYLKIQLPDGQIKELKSELPEDLKKVLESLKT